MEKVQGMNSVANWHMVQLSLTVLWNNSNEIPKMLTTSQIVILLFPLHEPHFHMVCFTMDVQAFSTFNIWHTTCEVGKALRNLYPSHCLLSRSYFQYFDCCCRIFLQFRAKYNADMLLFQICHFLGMPKSWMEHTCVFNKTLIEGYKNP
jgi:hypothetical protein